MHFYPAASNAPELSNGPNELERKDPSFDVLVAGPIAVLLPLPCSKAESAILSAWTVLLKGYYSHNPVSFLRVGRTWTHWSSSEAGKLESISVDFQSEWKAVDLQEVLYQRAGSLSASDPGTNDDSDLYAVWFANEDISADECRQEIWKLEEASEASLC